MIEILELRMGSLGLRIDNQELLTRHYFILPHQHLKQIFLVTLGWESRCFDDNVYFSGVRGIFLHFLDFYSLPKPKLGLYFINLKVFFKQSIFIVFGLKMATLYSNGLHKINKFNKWWPLSGVTMCKMQWIRCNVQDGKWKMWITCHHILLHVATLSLCNPCTL